ncbi:hypothetical protein CWO91_16745 [Bradyrhizobium genosp. SA-3]|uniref:hypothetical protein n=1 Tax=Bradyrhizobium genosp. SA-3 TaxID=508868 RepID=UPI00102940D4|nr:hypothetical protein [Bradyrhizobium genosp. SA-3]RZN09676.1 hypothetical protein CWO91_16745 [Bradyrhizobium genosp. SA-3]
MTAPSDDDIADIALAQLLGGKLYRSQFMPGWKFSPTLRAADYNVGWDTEGDAARGYLEEYRTGESATAPQYRS